ncbi:enoyl-CoA hydratase/isomerase family protein [Rhodococcus jostii]|uniref:Enoyl-CoA hydratase/isomerase n=1 Tax=Rhodococcus jostii TaxID=132919 RepID=A0A1H4JL25_RHOJO|nr:enoyl-CoA hydratase/isomerase family protein [Rhodococcus jostii]SEB46665.1 Enoyl-CoA hydratase/isomerase [Rhodococcus jostii]
MSIESGKVKFEIVGNAALITLNDGARRNALGPDIRNGVLQGLDAALSDDDVNAIVLTGSGPAFCAGGDFRNDFLAVRNDPRAIDSLLTELFGLFRAIEKCAKPVICAVNGFALAGGMEIVLSSHLAVASSEAVFGLPEPMVLGVPAGYAVSRIQRQIARKHANEIVLLGERLSAQRAADIGLVNRVVPPNEVVPVALELAEKIAQASLMAIQTSLEYLSAGDTGEELQHARRTVGSVFCTPDVESRIDRFLDRSRNK